MLPLNCFFRWTNAVACLLGLLGVASEHAAAKNVEVISGRAMGTSFTLKIAKFGQQIYTIEISNTVSAELERLESIFSLYRPESEISRLNSADAREWIAVSDDLYSVLEFAFELVKQTDGAFDPTIRPVVALWQSNRLNSEWSPPSRQEVEAAMKSIGIAQLRIRPDPPAVQKLSAQVQLDLNALVEGWAIERVLELLQGKGYENALFELGGEIGAIGFGADGQNWRVGIEDPRELSKIYATADLLNSTLCASGTYRQSRAFRGKSYSHIMDPRTGYPIDHDLISVSVVHENAMIADGWATALMVLGPNEGLRLAEKNGLAAGFVSLHPGSPKLSEFAARTMVLVKQPATNQESNQVLLRVLAICLGLIAFVALLNQMRSRRRHSVS